jgi:hypothetical protein
MCAQKINFSNQKRCFERFNVKNYNNKQLARLKFFTRKCKCIGIYCIKAEMQLSLIWTNNPSFLKHVVTRNIKNRLIWQSFIWAKYYSVQETELQRNFMLKLTEIDFFFLFHLMLIWINSHDWMTKDWNSANIQRLSYFVNLNKCLLFWNEAYQNRMKYFSSPKTYWILN